MLGSALFGSPEYTGASHVLGELQPRRPIQINAPGEKLFLLSVEGLNHHALRGPDQAHNKRYLTTKATRSGRRLFNVKMCTAEQS
jgi:hypothetical protein